MRHVINIKVRNPDWYVATSESTLSRESWEIINEGKIPKHAIFTEFEYKFEILDYHEWIETKYNIEIYSEKNNKVNRVGVFTINNVKVVEFKGEQQSSFVVVSNELIHQFISAKKENGKLYWYVFLKENCNYLKLYDNVWITIEVFNTIQSLYGDFLIEKDLTLTIRKIGGIIN